MAEEPREESRLFALDPSHGPIIITGNSVRIELPVRSPKPDDGYEPDNSGGYISTDQRYIVSGTVLDRDQRHPSQTIQFPTNHVCSVIVHCEVPGMGDSPIIVTYRPDRFVTISFDPRVYPLQASGAIYTHYNADSRITRVDLRDDNSGGLTYPYPVDPDGRCEVWLQDGHL